VKEGIQVVKTLMTQKKRKKGKRRKENQEMKRTNLLEWI
jgi:hypothetical protein